MRLLALNLLISLREPNLYNDFLQSLLMFDNSLLQRLTHYLFPIFEFDGLMKL